MNAAIGAMGVSDERESRRIELVLYTSPNTILSARAVRNMAHILADYDEGAVVFEVCDIAKFPDLGARDGITFTPTLVRHYPAPRAWIIGDLNEDAVVRRMLEAAGVARRGDRSQDQKPGGAVDPLVWSLLRP
jgi:hypothetical protein